MMSCCCCGSAEPCAAQISIFKHLDSASLQEIIRRERRTITILQKEKLR